MKKYLIILFFIAGQNFLFAQFNTYHPFPDSNATWRVEQFDGNCPPPLNYCGAYYYTLTGDTVIGSYTYHKINNGPTAIRQDIVNKKVYIINYCSSSDTLLYDFLLNVGDTLKQQCTLGGPSPFWVSSIDSILVGSSYRKRFNICCGAPSFSIIEGIGSTAGVPGLLSGWLGGYNQLACFVQDNILLYEGSIFPDSCNALINSFNDLVINNNDTAIISPNPTSGIFTFQLNENTPSEVFIYNSLGQVVFKSLILNPNSQIDLSSHPRGIYFLKLQTAEKIYTEKIIIQ